MAAAEGGASLGWGGAPASETSNASMPAPALEATDLHHNQARDAMFYLSDILPYDGELFDGCKEL